MVKRTIATNWVEIVKRDETAALVNIDYSCPYCHMSTGEIILIGASNFNKIDSGFETDQVCVSAEKK
jgi:hypothetical protein